MAPPPPEPAVAVAVAAPMTTTALEKSTPTPTPTPAVESQPPTTTPTPEGQRSSPPPFLIKTYQLVDDPAVNDVISWNGEGSAFVVWRPVEFARDLLPKYFKHSNFSSFVRQLNTYGFRKIATDRWEFANESFRRGEKRLLCDIHRRKVPISMAAATPPVVAVPLVALISPANSAGEEQVMSSSSAAMAGTDLSSENERLRRENEQLSRELSEMKSLCNNILSLMSHYAAKTTVNLTAAPKAVALELMPAVVEQSPRLFGVSIGEKRTRSDELHDPNKEVKRALSDSDPIDRQDPQNWLLCCPPPANQ